MQGADAIHYPENLTSLVHINDSIQKTVFLFISTYVVSKYQTLMKEVVRYVFSRKSYNYAIVNLLLIHIYLNERE